MSFVSSFPRKREPGDFGHLPWVPACAHCCPEFWNMLGFTGKRIEPAGLPVARRVVWAAEFCFERD